MLAIHSPRVTNGPAVYRSATGYQVLKKSTPLKRHICCVLIYNNSPLSVEVKHGFCFVITFCRHREAIKKIRHVFFYFIVTYVNR